MAEPSPETSVMLSVQRALLGAVTPDMRAVAVRWREKTINIRIIFSDPPSEDDIERTSVIETEIIADFHDDWTVACIAEAVPPNVKIKYLDSERLAYHRAEDTDYDA